MPSDDYAPLGGGGALKLKGAKVDKKKKKKKAKSDLVKNLAGPEGDESKTKSPEPEEKKREPDVDFVPQKTEAERRHEEIRRKRVSQPNLLGFDSSC
jgi:protein FAM32A